MINALRNFVKRLGAGGPERHFGEDDQRLALAALLIHVMGIDGTANAAERAKVEEVLGRTFGLSGDDLQVLMADAIKAEREAVDLYRFTSVLKRQMSEADRVRAVEQLWEIVFADGRSHEFEENLVWRAAELLGVSRQDRIARKLAVGASRINDDGNSQ